MNHRSFPTLAAAATLAAGVSILGIGTAQADGGHSEDRGDCSMHSTFELKASPDGGKIRVEVRVETGHQGQLWYWSITDNGMVAASGQAKSEHSSDGRLEVQRRIDDRMGRDGISLLATNAASGETCSGYVALGGH